MKKRFTEAQIAFALCQVSDSNPHCLAVCLDNEGYRTNNRHSNRRVWAATPFYNWYIRRRTDTSRSASFHLSEGYSWGKLVPKSKRFPHMDFGILGISVCGDFQQCNNTHANHGIVNASNASKEYSS